jgi:hypothetical protein
MLQVQECMLPKHAVGHLAHLTAKDSKEKFEKEFRAVVWYGPL